MPDRFLAAVVQMSSGPRPEVNLAAAEELVAAAAARGAALVILPEMFLQIDEPAAMVAVAGEWAPRARAALSKLSERCRVTLVGGSLFEPSEAAGKAFNTTVVFGPDGVELARYRKIHLFDVDVPGRVSYCESSHVAAGESIVAVDTTCGRLGLSICYDLRFPELYRRLASDEAELIAVPSAFAEGTGRDHWEVLLRARAIENQSYVLAANQCGQHAKTLTTYGHSMVIDPWGTILAIAAEGPGIALAEIDRARLADVRRGLPALRHRRGVESWPKP